jgi:hypothetical protein
MLSSSRKLRSLAGKHSTLVKKGDLKRRKYDWVCKKKSSVPVIVPIILQKINS